MLSSAGEAAWLSRHPALASRCPALTVCACARFGRRARLAPSQLVDLEDDAELRGRLDMPTLDELRWRLDVIISSSSVQVVLRPQLTVQCTLSDGSVHAFYVSKQQFNELRYTAARCLKEVEDLEARMPALP